MEKLFYHHNFGHEGKENFQGLGINAKMSELQAAMGLAVFPYLEEIINERKKVVETYINKIENLQFLKIRPGTSWNFSYFPVIFKDENQLLEALKILEKEGIYPRRYFYPSLDTLPYVVKSDKISISSDISKRILCLPLFHDLPNADLKNIINIINNI